MDIIAQARRIGDDRPEREVVADVASSHGYRLALCRFDGDAPTAQPMFSRPAFIAVVAVMVLLIVALVVLKRKSQ